MAQRALTSPGPGGALAFDAMFVGAPGAVLQHGAWVAVWGTAPAGAVRVRLLLDGTPIDAAGVNATTNVWRATLPPQAPQFNRTLTAEVAAAGTARGAAAAPPVSVRVHFGHVVLCSGQSNMGMSVGYGAPATVPPHGFGPDKPSFSADNGTAETAASGAYTGRIFIRHVNAATATAGGGTGPGLGLLRRGEWNDVNPNTLGDFSAVCWYSGVALWEQARDGAPLGLVQAAVGGSPIEFWIPPADPSDVDVNPCGVDRPQCDTSGGKNDSQFFREYIAPIAPYTFGALVWDQAERDVKCPRSLAHYDCLQRYLVSSWQKTFNSTFAFVGVQLAGYTAALKNGTGAYPGIFVTGEMVQQMRLQQEAGCTGVERCSVAPTYDVSCQAGVDGGCPYGSVHQPHKREIGRRVGLQMFKHLVSPQTTVVTQGPRATAVSLVATVATTHTLSVTFAGGATPFALRGTRNCTTLPGFCCNGSANSGHTVDFDATCDGGSTWTNGTAAVLAADGVSVRFNVTLPAPPTVVRYTAASIWPQCALYNAEGLPALPFTLPVASL
eukprot:g6005.t1